MKPRNFPGNKARRQRRAKGNRNDYWPKDTRIRIGAKGRREMVERSVSPPESGGVLGRLDDRDESAR